MVSMTKRKHSLNPLRRRSRLSGLREKNACRCIFFGTHGISPLYCIRMDVGSCESCQACRDLRWEVQYRQSLHARALERESRWRKKAEKSDREARALAAELQRLSERLEASEARVAWLEQQVFGRKTEQTAVSAALDEGDTPSGESARCGDEGESLDGGSDDRRCRGASNAAPQARVESAAAPFPRKRSCTTCPPAVAFG